MLSHLQLPQQKNQCDPRCFPFGPIQGRAGCPVPAQSQKHIAVRIEAPSCTSVFPVLTKRTCAKFMIPHSVRLAQRRANNSGELLEDQDDHLWTRHVKVSSESEKSLLRSHEPSNEASMGERELQALGLAKLMYILSALINIFCSGLCDPRTTQRWFGQLAGLLLYVHTKANAQVKSNKVDEFACKLHFS